MAELNLKQIMDKLNAEFAGVSRKLIFWFDANAEFEEDIDTLALENAKVLRLRCDNQFYIKRFLECVDATTNYLVYAPFAKPDIRENHLADTIHYSKEFFADRASLLALDLGIEERYKPVLQHYIRFFAEKKRTHAFYDLEIDAYNRSTLEIGMMCVLAKCKTPSFEEVLRCVLSEQGFEDNPYLAEFARFDLLGAFWGHCEGLFGYADEAPTLEKFVMTLFVTYAAKTIHAELPGAWKPYGSFKSGNIIAFLDNLMNSYLYAQCFDEISERMFLALSAENQLAKLPIDALVDLNLFAGVDRLILRWLIERLECEDVEAKLGGKSILETCAARRKKHFGQRFRDAYFVIENALYLIKPGSYTPVSNIDDIIRRYTETDCLIDRRYRYFYYYFDRLQNNGAFERLRELVEKIYTNDYLNRIASNYTQAFADSKGMTGIANQTAFYSRFVASAKERVVVIISDALRYEVGLTLCEKLHADEKCTASISVMQSVLPSITRYGMAALLSHRDISYDEDGKVLVDGQPCDDLKQREAILKKAVGNSRCVQYDALKGMRQAELRDIFTGQDVVYVYHNQIDARGDKANTENEVFNACEEAIEEIFAMIKRLTTSANTVRFIVTADHGFIYKRDKLTESDKISGMPGAGKRYLVTDKELRIAGITSVPFGNDGRYVYFPIGTDIINAPGSGLNYVHGGCSPQEMLVPVISVKTEKAFKETTAAQITLISLATKITNLITSLDFMQTEPISDVVKEARYRVFFVDDAGEKISSENIYSADRRDKETAKRIFRLRFSFKNKKYDKSRKHYLVACDDKTGMEILRHEVLMDIAFADDFGF